MAGKEPVSEAAKHVWWLRMKYRRHQKESNLFSFIEHQQRVQERRLGINRLNDLIDWELFRPRLEKLLGYDGRELRKGGRPPFDPVFMLKVLVLQKFHALSDLGVQQQIADRLSFMQFLGLNVGDDIPDANTIWDFKEALSRGGRDGMGELFAEFDEAIQQQGLIGREGSIVDASFVDVPRPRNTREQNEQIKEGQRPEGFEPDSASGRQKDCDARWTIQRRELHCGYKNHSKVDARTKLIVTYAVSSANVHDSMVFKQLVDGRDQAVLADSAYNNQEIEEYLLKECDCEEFLLFKSHRNRPLSEEERRLNKLRSRIRCRVEHVFGRLTQMGADFIRTIGLGRAGQQIGLGNLVYNLERYCVLRGA